MDTYKVCVEVRNSNGDVINSDTVFETNNRSEAVAKAIEYRKQYGTVVIETWTSNDEDESLSDTTFEYQY